MGVCIGLDPISESLSRLAEELAKSEFPELGRRDGLDGKDSVEADLALLDAALAAHESELEGLRGAVTARSERRSDNSSSDLTDEQRPSALRKRSTTEASLSSSWQERAFPGLSQRRWVQLLVDESVSVYADPVTLRQFLPLYDKANCPTGSFAEMDADHPYFIDTNDLRDTLKEHQAATQGKCSAKSGDNTCGSSESNPSDVSSDERFGSEVDSSWETSQIKQNVLGVKKGGIKKSSRPVSRTLLL